MAAATKKRKPGKRTAPKKDPYKLVTDLIVDALEHGVVPWHKPWRSVQGDGPRSLTTRKPYRGVNVFILGATAQVRGYTSQWWGTYNQIAERGGQVRRGETATTIVNWSFVGEEKDSTGRIVKRGIPYLRHFSVFNVDQCDDVNVPAGDELVEDREPLAACDEILISFQSAGGPDVKHGGNRASYSPSFDYIRMPKQGQFETVEHYYGTLFHECVHSTGHESRLGRKSLVDMVAFGDENYSREELIAEMGAAFVCGEAGIEVNVQHHAAYIENWLTALKDDDNRKLVVEAGGAAQRAANLILGRNPAAEGTEKEQA